MTLHLGPCEVRLSRMGRRWASFCVGFHPWECWVRVFSCELSVGYRTTLAAGITGTLT